jgi:hypothetical protein
MWKQSDVEGVLKGQFKRFLRIRVSLDSLAQVQTVAKQSRPLPVAVCASFL